ncbi:uncharacterized protein B0H18DRAFT_1218041 [Fomitopsis serialis]|uniref:uncharacterized protein n=1 Tax=Fomitopsis serialis TaxID=139415 RepID=UPI0020087DB5|nr:uncharacterized protein B0H18DRAFT_1218041 [Neoantrodia serialis]KAH9911602.1 hypothetical protein B0H18DRAFT_1218041 [Neoantrodia serialis]
MPASRRASHRASKPPTRSAPLTARSSVSRAMARQASQAERETRLSDQLIRYGCLWEEHAHYVRLREKTPEGFSLSYTRALDRWIKDPEFSRWQGPTTNYAEERDSYIDWIEGVIRSHCKPDAEMTTEDHWIVTFAAFSVSDVLRCNEPCMKDPEVIGRLKPAIGRKLADCARAFQDSEPDFLNHPAHPKSRGTAPQRVPLPNIADGSLLGVIFEYKTRTMARARTCMVTGVVTSIDDGAEYIIKHLTAKDPDGERAKKVTLSEDKFREIWGARVE